MVFGSRGVLSGLPGPTLAAVLAALVALVRVGATADVGHVTFIEPTLVLKLILLLTAAPRRRSCCW